MRWWWTAVGLVACGPSGSDEAAASSDRALQQVAPGQGTDTGLGSHGEPHPDETQGVLQLTPARLELGQPDPRCGVSAELVWANVGDGPLELQLEPPAGWSADRTEATLSPGGEQAVVLTWESPEAGPWSGVVTVVSNGDEHDVPVVIEPVLPTAPAHVVLGDRTTADLLMAVDRGCNLDDLSPFVAQLPVLRDTLGAAEVDLRMASVVDDDACIRGEEPVAGPELDDAAFQERITDQQNWLGDLGSYTEKLLELGARALEKSSGGCNTGLLSGTAPVHLLGFSDEPDQSDITWEEAVARGEEAVGSVPFVVHGIGGPLDMSCAAQPYWGVSEAAEATGGVLLPICEADKAETARQLGAAMLEVHRRVDLAGLGLEELQSVRWEGAELEGWSQDGDALVLPLSALGAERLDLVGVLPAVCD